MTRLLIVVLLVLAACDSTDGRELPPLPGEPDGTAPAGIVSPSTTSTTTTIDLITAPADAAVGQQRPGPYDRRRSRTATASAATAATNIPRGPAASGPSTAS